MPADYGDIIVHPVSEGESSFVRGIHYLPEEEIMEVRLKHEDYTEMPYYYPETPEYKFNNFASAHSYGSHYSKNIKANSSARDYRSNLGGVATNLRSVLQEKPMEFIYTIQQNAPDVFADNRLLFDAIEQRQYDESVLHVQNSNYPLQAAFEFRQRMFQAALDELEDAGYADEEWYEECEELAETCAKISRSQLVADNL